jgi:hypothetical protein
MNKQMETDEPENFVNNEFEKKTNESENFINNEFEKETNKDNNVIATFTYGNKHHISINGTMIYYDECIINPLLTQTTL